MTIRPLLAAALTVLPWLAPPARADVPVPLQSPKPVDVARLRPGNPAVLPMTGSWRFEGIRGAFATGGKFVPVNATASSVEQPADLAIDGKPDTRWCASSAREPQWWQVNLGSPRQVTAVDLAWEIPDGHYRFRIETSDDGRQWTTAADRTGGSGEGDATVPLSQSAPVRVLRVAITAAADAHDQRRWASIREVRIHYRGTDGRDAVWAPPTPAAEAGVPPFVTTGFDDRDWRDLPVPGNWEMYGFSDPTYHRPDDAAGLYRRWVDVPASFAGQRVRWHFDAVMDGAEVFVNGVRVGYHEGGFTGWDLDVTDALRPGQRNLFALRVCKRTPTVQMDSGDFWNLGGISRDTYLLATPPTHVDDLTVTTPLSANYRDATLATSVHVRGTPGQPVAVSSALYRLDGSAVDGVAPHAEATIADDGTATLGLSAPVASPKLWSAEHPDLYYLVLSLSAGGKPVEAVQQRFGFRQVEIKDGVLLWNGVAIKCTGSCRHEEWSALGHALDEHAWQTDVAMMKAANINAVRTSHYNHAVRFLELCDEKGLYVLDEIPACWSDNKDPALLDAYVRHAAETLSRDKNRPCVLAWSCGNESGYGPNFKAMVDYALDHDPTRPAFVSEQKRTTYPRLSFDDYHYPGAAALKRIAAAPGPAVVTEGPHIFYVKPGWQYDYGTNDLWGQALAAQWDVVWPSTSIFGAFIWEWQDQGLLDPYADPAKKDERGVTGENSKGIVDGFRNPKPEYWHVKMVYSPVTTDARTVKPDGAHCRVTLRNRYAFTDLSELTCHWRTLAGATELAAGDVHVACPPGGTVDATFPASEGMDALSLEFVHPDGRSIYTAKLHAEGMPLPAPPAAPAVAAGATPRLEQTAAAVTVAITGDTLSVDRTTGRATFTPTGATAPLWSGPTLNVGEHRVDDGAHLDRRGAPWLFSKQPPQLLHPDVSAVSSGDHATITVVGDVALAESPAATLGRLTFTLDVRADGTTDVRYELAWTSAPANAWELGMTFALPARYDHLGWYRDAQWTAYPPDHIGAVTGRVDAADVSFRSTKRDAVWATLTDGAGDGVAVLRTSTPLHVRANATDGGTTLFASSAVATPRDFSSGYLDRYRIRFEKGQSKAGAFTLRGVAGPR
jgi:beta-galactosidase